MKPKARKRRAGLVVLAWFALGFEFVVALFTSPYLAPARVSVYGARGEDWARMRHVVAESRTKALFSVDRGSIRRAIESDPHIRKAEVGYGFPYALSVRVQYRVPDVVVTDGESAYFVDATRAPYQRISDWVLEPPAVERLILTPARGALSGLPGESNVSKISALTYAVAGEQARKVSEKFGLPVIRISTMLLARLGEPTSNSYVNAALDALVQMRARNFPRNLRLAVDSKGFMCLNMDGVATIRLGNKEQMDLKVSKLQTMLLSSPWITEGVEYFDFGDPSILIRKLLSAGKSEHTRTDRTR